MKYVILAILYLAASSLSAATQKIPSNWHEVQLNNFTEFRGSAIYKNYFWLSGSHNSVYMSPDGGKTWHKRSIKSDTQYDFRDIHVFDEDSAIVMAAGSGKKSALFYTQDQGITWQLLYQNPFKTGFFNAIDFWDRENGILMGDPISDQFMIMTTKDGGESWQPQTNVPKLEQKEAAFAASGQTLIINKEIVWFTSGGLQASVYQSRDRGHHWQKQAVPLYKGTQTAGGYSLGTNSQGRLFVMGGDYLQRDGLYNNLATLNHLHWQTVTTSQNGLRTSLACVKDICIATGKLSSDISVDGGKTWRSYSTSGFYTLAHSQQVILGGGAKGKVGILKIELD